MSMMRRTSAGMLLQQEAKYREEYQKPEQLLPPKKMSVRFSPTVKLPSYPEKKISRNQTFLIEAKKLVLANHLDGFKQLVVTHDDLYPTHFSTLWALSQTEEMRRYLAATLLYSGIVLNNTKVIDLALEKKADVNDKEIFKSSPMFIAAAFANNPEVLNVLWNNKADIFDKNSRGSTPLHYAVKANNAVATQWLLEHKVNENAVNRDGYTPLHSAVLYCSLESLDLLMKFAVNLYVGSKKEADTLANPFECAVSIEQKAKILRRMLTFSINQRDIKLTDYLLQQGVNPYISAKLMFEAIKTTEMKFVKLLAANGINPEVVDHAGNTYLFYAVQQGNVDMVRFFLEKGANVLQIMRSGYDVREFAKTPEIRQLLDKAVLKNRLKRYQQKLTNAAKNSWWSYFGLSSNKGIEAAAVILTALEKKDDIVLLDKYKEQIAVDGELRKMQEEYKRISSGR